MKWLLSFFIFWFCASLWVCAQHASFENAKMNLLYIGVKTPIKILMEGKMADEVIAKASYGCLLEKRDRQWYISVNCQAGEVWIYAGYINAKKDTVWADSVSYRVRKLPEPDILFGTKSPGRISKGEVQSVQMVNASLGQGFAYEGIGHRILGYRATVFSNNSIFSRYIYYNRVTGEFRAAYSKAGKGAYIILDQILVLNLNTLDSQVFNEPQVWRIVDPKDSTPPRPFEISGQVRDAWGLHKLSIKECDNTHYDNWFPQGSREGEWTVTDLQTGRRSSSIFFRNDTITGFISYYADGKIKGEKHFDNAAFKGMYFLNYPSGTPWLKGEFLFGNFPSRYNIVDDSIFQKNTLARLNIRFENKPGAFADTSYDRVDEFIFGHWQQYYPDGKLKEEGRFDTTMKNRWWYDDRDITFLDSQGIPTDEYFSVRDGDWAFYDTKGRKTVVKYNKGSIMK